VFCYHECHKQCYFTHTPSRHNQLNYYPIIPVTSFLSVLERFILSYRPRGQSQVATDKWKDGQTHNEHNKIILFLIRTLSFCVQLDYYSETPKQLANPAIIKHVINVVIVIVILIIIIFIVDVTRKISQQAQAKSWDFARNRRQCQQQMFLRSKSTGYCRPGQPTSHLVKTGYCSLTYWLLNYCGCQTTPNSICNI